MRRINYGNRDRFIAEEEQPLKRKGINWDRVVYLSILFILAGSLVVYLIDRYVYLTFSGQVVNKSHLVYLSDDAYIYDVYVEEDDFVQVGDSLFLFKPEIDRTDNALFNSIQSAEASKERDLADARRNLVVLQAEYNENLKLIKSYEEKIKEIELMVLLDANSSERANSFKIEIDKLKAKNEVILAEIRYWRNYIANAPKRTSNYQNTLNARISDNDQMQIFFSTVSGHVDRINYQKDQLVYKGQSVMDFVQEEVFALTYLAEDDFGLLMEGDEVSLKFADGQEDEGVIEIIYANLNNVPPHYLRNNSAPNNYYLVIIEPKTNLYLNRWRKNAGLRIKVTKKRTF